MQSIPPTLTLLARRWPTPFRTLALGPVLWLVVACQPADTGHVVTVASAPLPAPPATVVEGVVEAEYGDSMLVESVAVASSQADGEDASLLEDAPDLPEVEVASFTLRRGETLAHFARWSELPVEEIAEISDLALDGHYPVGTVVDLPLSGEQLASFVARRDAHQTERVSAYLASRGGSVEEEVYSVRTGDSAWGIARQAGGVPVWLLESYNPDVDLERLKPGDKLTIPVLADVVVDAEDAGAK